MARPLRIAHLTTVDMSLVLLLGTELEVDLDAGHMVFGLSAPGPYVAQLEASGVIHVPLPSLTRAWCPRADVAAAGELFATLRRLRLDVLHVHNPKTGVLGRVLGRLAGVPAVVNTCHGLWARPDDRLVKKVLVHGVEAFAAQWSHAELYQNGQDRRTLRWAVRQRKARTVGNGIDLRRFGADEVARARVRAELGIPPDTLLVGGVGRRVAEKGIREFAVMARALAGRAAFVWVGPDDEDKPDRLAADERGVRFLGLRHDMPAVYAALDVFVLPSYREGFSRSAMEAAASGCVLVLSDIRGCREIGRDGHEVLLVPARNAAALTAAVRAVLDDYELRERLAKAAAHRAAAHFDQRQVAQVSLDTYASLLSARRRD